MDHTLDLSVVSRFVSNTQRISKLILLLAKDDIDELKSDVFGHRDGAGAELMRLTVVFLHTCFEDFLKGLARKPKFTFSSYNDLDFALKRARIRTENFKPLYPPLKQLAIRRNRIVHDADLADPTATEAGRWSTADEWSSWLWLLAVLCFFYRVVCHFHPDIPEFGKKHDSMVQSILQWREYGLQLIKLANAPEEDRLAELSKLKNILRAFSDNLGALINA